MTAPPLAGTVSVLLVDDTPTLRRLMRMALDGTGFDVVGEAGDGQAAVELAAQLEPDLVLLDLAMPVMDGLEALPLLRAVLPRVRIVILSGFDRRAMESQVMDAGADAYLQKGQPPAVMLDTLRDLFPEAQPPAPPPQAAPPAVPAPRLSPEEGEAGARLRALEEDMEQDAGEATRWW